MTNKEGNRGDFIRGRGEIFYVGSGGNFMWAPGGRRGRVLCRRVE